MSIQAISWVLNESGAHGDDFERLVRAADNGELNCDRCGEFHGPCLACGVFHHEICPHHPNKRPAIAASKRAIVYARNGLRCVRCGSNDDLTIDHVWPLAHGGTDDLDNLQTLCRRCNVAKGARA